MSELYLTKEIKEVYQNLQINHFCQLFLKNSFLLLMVILSFILTSCGVMMTATMPKEQKEIIKNTKVQLASERTNSYNNLEIVENSSYSGQIYIDGKKVDKVLKAFPIMEAGMDVYFTIFYLGHLSPGTHYLVEVLNGNELCRRVSISGRRKILNFGKRTGIISESAKESISEFHQDYGKSPYLKDYLGEKGVLVFNRIAEKTKTGEEVSLLEYFELLSNIYPQLSDEYQKLQKMEQVWKKFKQYMNGDINVFQLKQDVNSMIKLLN